MSSVLTRYCFCCFKGSKSSEKLISCNRCRVARYCSSECQSWNYDDHKRICLSWREQSETLLKCNKHIENPIWNVNNLHDSINLRLPSIRSCPQKSAEEALIFAMRSAYESPKNVETMSHLGTVYCILKIIRIHKAQIKVAYYSMGLILALSNNEMTSTIILTEFNELLELIDPLLQETSTEIGAAFAKVFCALVAFLCSFNRDTDNCNRVGRLAKDAVIKVMRNHIHNISVINSAITTIKLLMNTPNLDSDSIVTVDVKDALLEALDISPLVGRVRLAQLTLSITVALKVLRVRAKF